jgi:hypothetical protein
VDTGAWGHGHPEGDERRLFDPTVFMQADVWRDEEGWLYLLEDLSPREKLELASWLRRHVRHFYLQELRREFARVLRGASLEAGRPGSAAVPDMVFLSAEEWMAQTPLLVALST